ncbi:hypothetical protein D2N39_22195 [Gemmobacter lutimaris]|uniref:Transposase n=1 Tax=Gemmobacter lutimaris TaxID=2306023 RepID=A0A398BKX9_9RHOB|nr:hypothetical protein D2N39_22195 [Gemmobacter lutimaris]
MQDSAFIGLNVHKATISMALAQGERGGEVRHWGTVPNRPDHIRRLVERLTGHGYISAMRRCLAAIVSIANFSRWGMNGSVAQIGC